MMMNDLKADAGNLAVAGDDAAEQLSASNQPLSAIEAETDMMTQPIPPIGPEAAQHHINREISWLAFNERVLAEARSRRHPLLERLRFVAISANNLDEFLMVRVAGLKQQVKRGYQDLEDRYPAAEKVLEVLDQRVRGLLQAQQDILPALLGDLSAAGVSLVPPEWIEPAENDHLSLSFQQDILPVIAPLTIDPAHPFPFIPNKGMGLYLELEDAGGEAKQALIMISARLDRFVPLSEKGDRFIALEDAIALNLGQIFPEHRLVNRVMFRVLRDSELELDEEAEDLVATFESALKARRRGNVIALQLSAAADDQFVATLTDQLMADAGDIAFVGGMIGLSDLDQLCRYGEETLRFPAYSPRFPERIRDFGGDCFAAIRAKDILVHHPYESFDVVLQFLRQAAEDPKVVSIRQTLYRTLPDSPIVRALISAAEQGKSVTAVVEIKARFDEERNIRLARDLERAGVQVVYGFVDLKTHAKLSLVARQEETGLRCYAHCGTGNYHPVTARIYTDLSYFTCDPLICADIMRVFNYMTSYVKPDHLSRVAVAPLTGRSMLMQQIDNEIEAAKAGKPCGIWMKVNSLVDPDAISSLYRASSYGVPIELVVRGVCCLRPGIPGVSETIRVTSLIGRFLEHSRIYIFANGAELPNKHAQVFIASADLMPRNLDRRVEMFMPITNPTVHRQIVDQVMMANLRDTENTWELQADGSYVYLGGESKPFSAHHFFMTNPSLSGRGSAISGKKSARRRQRKK